MRTLLIIAIVGMVAMLWQPSKSHAGRVGVGVYIGTGVGFSPQYRARYLNGPRYYRPRVYRPRYYRPFFYNPPVYYRPRRAYRRGFSNAHYRYCYNRYRSYRASDNTFQPYRGPRRACRSRY